MDSDVVVMKVPRDWAEELKTIAEAEDPMKKWSAKAREIIRGYLDMRAANVDPLKRLNAKLEEKAAQAGAQ